MAWVSSIFRSQEYAIFLGLSAKYYGYDWDENPSDIPPRAPESVSAALSRHVSGGLVERHEFPEASYIFKEKIFKKNLLDFLYIDAFYAVTGKLARILQDFNFGEGGGLFPIQFTKRIR